MEVFIHGVAHCIINWANENRVGLKKTCLNLSSSKLFLVSISSILIVGIIIQWRLMALERFILGAEAVQNLIRDSAVMEILLMWNFLDKSNSSKQKLVRFQPEVIIVLQFRLQISFSYLGPKCLVI